MYVEREIVRNFRKIASAYNAIAVVGARQAGKTTFLKEQMKQTGYSYVLFDDPEARTLFEKNVKKFEKQYVEGYEVAILDEVQYCKNAGMNLKYLVDKGRKIWVTSSSEIILGKEILSYLVGRVSILRLYPFSLSEFLTAMGQKEMTEEALMRNVWEHMTYGGYPKVVVSDDVETKKMMLKDIYDTMILKDVAQTFSIDDMRALEDFTKYLSANIGGALSYEKLSRSMNISFRTMVKYLDAMEKSYLIARVPPFHTNKQKEIIKQPKLYFIDTGLRNAITKNFPTEPDGHLFENYVFSELLKMGFAPKYWKTKVGAEVDFIVEKGNEIVPIEAKISAKPGKIERSLRSFIETYEPKTALVVSYNGDAGKMDVAGCNILFTNAFEMKGLLKRD